MILTSFQVWAPHISSRSGATKAEEEEPAPAPRVKFEQVSQEELAKFPKMPLASVGRVQVGTCWKLPVLFDVATRVQNAKLLLDASEAGRLAQQRL